MLMMKCSPANREPEFGLMFQDISALSIQNFMDGITEFLVGISDQLDSRYDTDLLNLRDEMWDHLCEAVEAGQGFSLEYGAEQHNDDVLEWMLNRDYIVDSMFEEEEEDEDATD